MDPTGTIKQMRERCQVNGQLVMAEGVSEQDILLSNQLMNTIFHSKYNEYADCKKPINAGIDIFRQIRLSTLDPDESYTCAIGGIKRKISDRTSIPINHEDNSGLIPEQFIKIGEEYLESNKELDLVVDDLAASLDEKDERFRKICKAVSGVLLSENIK